MAFHYSCSQQCCHQRGVTKHGELDLLRNEGEAFDNCDADAEDEEEKDDEEEDDEEEEDDADDDVGDGDDIDVGDGDHDVDDDDVGDGDRRFEGRNKEKDNGS